MKKLDWPFDSKWLRHYQSHPPGAYRPAKVAKHDGTPRTVFSPEPQLHQILDWLQHELRARLVIHGADHAVPGRSILTHAQVHTDSFVLLTMDVSNFFGAVPLKALRQALEDGVHPRDRSLVETICTYRGAIPQGAPTSPVLAAASFYPVDAVLDDLASSNGARYSRYVDDLAFSWGQGTLPARSRGSKEPLPPAVEAVKLGAAVALRALGYAPAAGKTRAAYPWEPQRVTGLVVNFEPGCPPVRAPREHWRRLRAGVFNLRERHVGDWEELQGLAAFLAMVEPDKAAPFVRELEELRDA